MKTLATAFALVGACALVAIVNEPLVPEPAAPREPVGSVVEAVALHDRHAECGDPLADCGGLHGRDAGAR